MLLHEPEAAAMACLKQQMHPVPFVEGNTFAVVDAGGGTVDITTHQVCSCCCSAACTYLAVRLVNMSHVLPAHWGTCKAQHLQPAVHGVCSLTNTHARLSLFLLGMADICILGTAITKGCSFA